MKVQAQEVPGTRPSDGSETGVFKSVLPFSDKRKEKMHITTLMQGFQETVTQFANRPCLGHRPKTVDPSSGKVVWGNYVWQSYRRVSERRVNFGSGLVGIVKETSPGEERFGVGIYSINRPEWAIADLANISYGLVTVPLYDTLGATASQYILNHSTPPVLICSYDKLENVVGFIHLCPSVKALVSMDEVTPATSSAFGILKKWAADKGVSVYSFAEVEALGAKARLPFVVPKPDDVCCISYTSGTTGEPKGAMLTHKNLVSMLQSSLDHGIDYNENDVYISYLPMAHVYEKVAFTALTGMGAAVGFYRGDVGLLIEDIATLRPTVFCSVPRLLNRIHDKIHAQANSTTAFRAALFKKAVDAKIENYEASGILTHSIWDALVFRKVQAALGGRVRSIASSSAPIHPGVLSFLTVAFGCEVLEAYGQTEAAGGITMQVKGDRDSGHVGSVLTSLELKLVSVPEMNYFAKDNKGEVWARGPTVFKGYFKDEAKTREAVTEDGWLKTGDIGRLDELGRLYIIDRKKNIFKLSQGEYIAPEKIENVYIKASTVVQMFVHGESLRNELVGIAVLDPETCIPLGRKLGLLPANTPDSGVILPGAPVNPHVVTLAQNPEFKKYVMKEMAAVAANAKLAGFEQVKAVHLVGEAFGVENGLLTPTMKLKRVDAVKKFSKEIEAMYKDIEANAKPVSSKL
ncbi:Long-chain-fatty-acid--CoA ligase 5 [Chytriomyces hyalinus]|nr:Long-chain-fatty-acid--CoA ligase 5 [Chytriomyces hyalinus]